MYQVNSIPHEIAKSKLNTIGKTVFWLAAVAAIPGSFYGPHWLAAYCRSTQCKALPTDILACHQLAFATTDEISQLPTPLGHKCRYGQLRYVIEKDNIPSIMNKTCNTTLPKKWKQWRDESLDCSLHPEHCQIPPQQRIAVCADKSELEWMKVVSTSINLQQHCRHVESEFNVGEIVCGIILGLLYLCCLFNLIIAVQASDRARDCYLYLSAAITSLICLPAVLLICLEQRQARQAYPPLRANAGPSLCSKIAAMFVASKAGLINCVTSTGRGLYHFFHCCQQPPLAAVVTVVAQGHALLADEVTPLPVANARLVDSLPIAPRIA